MNIDEQMQTNLARLALKARETAYAPYSGFTVGAALLASSGKIYTGANIENAAYTPSSCAERTAFFKAVSEGERSFVAIAIAGAKQDAPADDYCAPCGVCRQVMLEFCKPDSFTVILAKDTGEPLVIPLSALTPLPFSPKNLE